MNIRFIRVKEGNVLKGIKERWAVLSPDLRETEFEGTLQECETFLKNSCPTGGCED